MDDHFLTGGVVSRRCTAWVLDLLLIALLVFALWWVLMMFGLLTFGLGFGALGILPFVPFCYNLVSLLGWSSATPGQQMMGLTVRRDYDLGPPTLFQALVSVLGFYLTLATTGLPAGGGAVHRATPDTARHRERTGGRAGAGDADVDRNRRKLEHGRRNDRPVTATEP